jgi:broad specificity phosphatase PhoE
MIARRRLFAIALLAVGLLVSASFAMVRPIWASEAAAWQALDQGAIVLFRHANAPGTGDPARFRLEDCSTQRNLDEAGREQARRWGQRFRERALTPGRVISSRWCRARETADLAFPGQRRDEPAFDSFFEAPQQRDAATTAARAVLAGWQGPGPLVVVTHQVNITALTGIEPRSGEGVVIRLQAGRVEVIGRLPP